MKYDHVYHYLFFGRWNTWGKLKMCRKKTAHLDNNIKKQTTLWVTLEKMVASEENLENPSNPEAKPGLSNSSL